MEFYFMGQTLTVIGVLGILAFLVVVITEMLKDFWIIQKIPTKLAALLVSFVVVMGGMTLYLNMTQETFVWWYLVVAFFAAFIVGYLSINGWDTMYDIWTRFVSGDKKGGDA